jgi:hypothetical protein
VAPAPSFKVVHRPGRIRIHIPDWRRFESTALEHRIRAVIGVQAVRVNRLRKNVLVWYGCPEGARERVLWLVDALLRTAYSTTPNSFDTRLASGSSRPSPGSVLVGVQVP